MVARRVPDDQLLPNALRQRRYRENPENRKKGAIRNRVHHALRTGRLRRSPCICGETKVEAHHYAGYDLEHALDVVWFCKKHHEMVHHTMPREEAA